FEIKKGETFGIIGRNGSGKSTLLQMICGTLNPTTGTIQTNGRVAALLELGSGFNPEFTGRENVYLNASVLGLNNKEIDERFDKIAEFADIGDFIEQPIKTYSSGMIVRLAFAVIAHVDADILVIDEALAVGDTVFTQKCMRCIREFKKNGTLLFVSHDQNAVSNLCDEVLWLSNGNPVNKGTTAEILTKYHIDNLAKIQSEIKIQTITGSKQIEKKIVTSDNFFTTLESNKIFSQKKNSTGAGKAVISSAAFTNNYGEVIKTFEGGEIVKLCLLIQAKQDISGLLVGFTIKDRLGQKIIEENNATFVKSKSISVKKGTSVVSIFEFKMPFLKAGKYSIDLAVAEGQQEIHVQQMWIYDALQIEFLNKEEVFGLFTMGLDNFEVAEVNG
ncbi:MAG TPA: ABC transporter ATP-binding protein, partial [Pyrinomonadaceae bacterium]|nr:ABC transporter ATP-binding protein [Pyrinomonadaceae bacterium]